MTRNLPELCSNDSVDSTTCPFHSLPTTIISSLLRQNAAQLKMNTYSPPSSVLDQLPKMDKRKSNNYKALKESFVSNLSGGPIWEINEVSLVLPVSLSDNSRHNFGLMLTTLGWCFALVRSSVSTAFLRTLHPCSRCYRFSHQLRLSTFRHHCLLEAATAVEYISFDACHSRAHQPVIT